MKRFIFDCFIQDHTKRKIKVITNKKEAIRLGRNTYKGNPCKRNHVGIRYTKSGSCIHCHREVHNKRPKLEPKNKMIAIDHINEHRKLEKEYDLL